ncbi:unnamed protein product [Sympodiomycopsis kandeliae]
MVISTTKAPPGNEGIIAEIEEKDLHCFESAGEFLATLQQLFPSHAQHDQTQASSSTSNVGDVNLPREEQLKLLGRLESILDEYQEQSYLLDPVLDQMVGPPIKILQSITRAAAREDAAVTASGSEREAHLAQVNSAAHLLYLYTKVRGYKTVVRYFPHEVADVVPTITTLLPYVEDATHLNESQVALDWKARYILLLWLSLVCMIPFELHKFKSPVPTSSTSDVVVRICQHFLSSAGKERDAAAVTLGKLFQRSDTSRSHLPAFIDWSQSQLSAGSRPTALLATGILQTLCGVLKTATPDVVAPHLASMQIILSMGDHGQADSPTLQHLRQNSLVNKYRSKLAARMGLKMLRPRANGRGVIRKRLGGGTSRPTATGNSIMGADDDDVPEDIDDYIAQLLNGLQDKDTVVRYTASKGLARISERLPSFFIDQVAEAVTRLLSINVITLPGKDEDYGAASEHTWQGACFCLAEMARRGLLNKDDMAEQLDWCRKALFFDVRRGSHSIGSAVRDAACYFFWALARAYDAETLRSQGLLLAQSLATLALLDREVSIRRAASAAYQECVGRLGIFPHGIEIIGKTDFFSIGNRRNAFLHCMPDVAIRHEYRQFFLDHMMKATITHWDPSMRQMGSQAIAEVAALDKEVLVPLLISKLAPTCKSRDLFTLHGALLSLSHLASLCDEGDSDTTSNNRVRILSILDSVPRTALQTLGYGQILEAACRVIANAASDRSLLMPGVKQSSWEIFLEAAMKRKEESVHTAAADAWHKISRSRNCAAKSSDIIAKWKSLTLQQQQSSALVLGSIRAQNKDAFVSSTCFLLSLVDKKSGKYASTVETRRNAFDAITSAITDLGSEFCDFATVDLMQTAWTALYEGMEDYTTDQRGDVGSWIRLACLAGIHKLLRFILDQALTIPSLHQWIPNQTYQHLLSGILKQMTERIDNVRGEAGQYFLSLASLSSGDPTVEGHSFPIPEDLELIQQTFEMDQKGQQTPEWDQLRDPNYLFPRVTRLLLIHAYRDDILRGLVQCIGSRTELSHRVVGQALVDFTLQSDSRFPSRQIYETLVDQANASFASNKIALGFLQAIEILLDSQVLEQLKEPDESDMPLMWKTLKLVSRSLDKIKSPQRLTTTMHVAVNLLAFENVQLCKDVLNLLPFFLSHQFPTIRAATAEKLYIVASDHFDMPEEAEDLLVSQPWSEARSGNFKSEAQQVVQSLLEAL